MSGAPLLIVEEAYDVPGLGLVVRPEPEHLDAAMRELVVELRRPDGTTATATAIVRTPHLAPTDRSKPPRRLLALRGVAPEDVPAGTAIFTV